VAGVLGLGGLDVTDSLFDLPAPTAVIARPAGLRILVTGSRDWPDTGLGALPIHRAIHAAALKLAPDPALWDVDGWMPQWPMITLVHGGARGFDAIAARCGKHLGMVVDPHRPDYDRHGDRAPLVRNQEMVDLGAGVCVAGPIGDRWSGTRHCMKAAAKAGIPIVEVSPQN